MSNTIQLGTDINRYNRAVELNQQIEKRNKAFILDTLVDLHEMFANHYYKDLGHKSMNDYLIHTMDIAKGQASKYVTILSDVIPLALPEKVSQRETFIPLDYEKLYALSKLKKKQLTQLFETGSVRLRGRSYTMAEINDMPRSNVIDLITEARSSGLPKPEKQLVWDQSARNKIADILDRLESTLKIYKDVMPQSMLRDIAALSKPLNKFYEDYLRKMQ